MPSRNGVRPVDDEESTKIMNIIANLCPECMDMDQDQPNVWVIFHGSDGQICAVQCVAHGHEATLVLDPFLTPAEIGERQ